MTFAGLPQRHFGTIVADPPWRFKSRTAIRAQNWKSPRHVERHYDTMTPDEIAALPVRDVTARDAHLFLWVTGPCLQQAFGIIDAWGFRYSAIAFTWIKLRRSHNEFQLRIVSSIESDFHIGLGLTTRHNAELCLLARRGNPRRLARNIRELIVAPVREHSRKPDEAYERAQRYAAGPYLELFARRSRPGWTTWGNEATKFDLVAAE